MTASSKRRIAWVAIGAALAVSWVAFELAYWEGEQEEATATSLAADQRRLGTAYGALEKCLLGDPPLTVAEDAMLRLTRVAAVAGADWPTRCIDYATAFREAAGQGETWRLGNVGADQLAVAVESGRVDNLRDALESIRYTTRSYPRDEVAGVPVPRSEVMQVALSDCAILPGSLGQKPGAIGEGPIRLQLHNGPTCAFTIAPTPDAKSVARCAYPRDALPERVPYHELLGESAPDAPTVGIFMAADDRSLVAFELESGDVLLRSPEESVRARGMDAISAAYLDEQGRLTVLFEDDRAGLLQRTPDGKTTRRALPGTQHWLVGNELFSLGGGARPMLSVTSLAGGTAASPAMPVGPVEGALDPRQPVSCGEGDTRFVTFWKGDSDETIVIGGSPGKYRILSTSGVGSGVTCHGRTTSLAGADRGAVRRQTCDIEGCKVDKGWSPSGATHAALAVDRETVLLASRGEDNTITIRAAPASEIGKAAPTALLYEWEYITVRTSWLIGRGEAALLLVETSQGVIPLRVGRDGQATPISIEWVETRTRG